MAGVEWLRQVPAAFLANSRASRADGLAAHQVTWEKSTSTGSAFRHSCAHLPVLLLPGKVANAWSCQHVGALCGYELCREFASSSYLFVAAGFKRSWAVVGVWAALAWGGGGGGAKFGLGGGWGVLKDVGGGWEWLRLVAEACLCYGYACCSETVRSTTRDRLILVLSACLCTSKRIGAWWLHAFIARLVL